MSALPDTVVPFQLPKKPKIREKQPEPDRRKVVVLPIKAVFDQNLTHGALQVLAALCAYCNRAGITWVSQTRLARELGISQQAVAKQFKQLRDHGYIETIRKGFKGERTDTLRVIFDASIDASTAISVASSIEDARPPYMKEEQTQNMTPDPEGQKRIAQLIAQALRQPTKQPERTMPKPGESVTVKKMKAEIEAHQKRRSKAPANHNPQVVNEKPSAAAQKLIHLQPNHNLEVVDNTENTGISKVIRQLDVLNNQQIKKLIEAGMTEQQIQEAADFLLPIYQAEGLTPTPDLLAESILQMHRDAA